MNVNILYKIKKNQINMMKKRGYDIPDFDQNILNVFQTFEIFNSSSFNVIYEEKIFRDRKLPKTLILYIESKDKTKIKKNDIDNTYNLMTQYGISNIIIISLSEIGTKSKQKLSTDIPSFHTSIFYWEELLIDPTIHRLSANISRILTSQEKDIIYKKYGPDKLPRICYDDPISKFYGLVEGDVILYIFDDNINTSIVNKHAAYRIVRGSIYSGLSNMDFDQDIEPHTED